MIQNHYCIIFKGIFINLAIIWVIMVGGDIDRAAIQEAFQKIKADIQALKQEVDSLRQNSKSPSLPSDIGIEALQSQIMQMATELSILKNTRSQAFDVEMMRQVIRETVKTVQPQKKNGLIEKINKKRKSVLMSRILNLAEKKNMTIPDIKDSVVDTEALCSKATFYRYIEKMKQRGLIDFAKIGDIQIVVKTE